MDSKLYLPPLSKNPLKKDLILLDNDPDAHGYGYMWYIAELDIKGQKIDYYFASGNGGNKIFIIPELNMVRYHYVFCLWDNVMDKGGRISFWKFVLNATVGNDEWMSIRPLKFR